LDPRRDKEGWNDKAKVEDKIQQYLYLFMYVSLFSLSFSLAVSLSASLSLFLSLTLSLSLFLSLSFYLSLSVSFSVFLSVITLSYKFYLIRCEVQSFEGRVSSESSERNFSDVIVAQIQEPQLRQSVHHETQITHLVNGLV
jgi:hypothetical protein